MSAQARIELTGNIQVHQPIKHNHQLLSGNGVHTCTGCSWTVETLTPPNAPATIEAVNRAFAKHLLIAAAEASA